MRGFVAVMAVAAATTTPARAQGPACPGGGDAEVAAFARANGGPAAFPEAHLAALTAFVRVERALCDGDLARARSALDDVWRRWPVGSDRWGFEWFVNGTHAGTPTGYYSLRIMDDIVEHERRAGRVPPADTAVWAVVVAPCAAGVQPRTMAEARAGRGTEVRRELRPEVRAGNWQVLRQVTELFRRYAEAMSQGRLAVALRVVEYPECVGIQIPRWEEGRPLFVSAQWRRLGGADALPGLEDADWIWAIAPALSPAEYPDFARAEIVTGGMGRFGRGGPLFLSDDEWLFTRPNHLGRRGPYSDLERRVYLPQWLQHEFFHHLFLRYPDFQLEARSHQWFDRTSWPRDFVGMWEPDYYAEALHKRLQRAAPPLHVALRYGGVPARLAAALTPAMVVGRYQRRPVENGYHDGRITLEAGGGMRWTNAARVGWSLTPDLANGRLLTGPDNPYHAAGATTFEIELARDAAGRWVAQVAGFRFQGELYVKVP